MTSEAVPAACTCESIAALCSLALHQIREVSTAGSIYGQLSTYMYALRSSKLAQCVHNCVCTLLVWKLTVLLLVIGGRKA
jgi:hypothetical protein